MSNSNYFQPGTSPVGFKRLRSDHLNEWLDRHSRTFFIAPALVLLLVFAIFPTFYSIIFALSRVKFTANGLRFRFVWFDNFLAQFSGNEQAHFLGRLTNISVLGWVFFAAVTAATLYWLYKSFRNGASVVGLIGRFISAAMAISIAFLFSATLLSGNPWGTLMTTLFYVFVGCTVQFFIGTMLALLCSQPISGKNFFRVLFFIPLMITPLGVGYAFKMVLDITKGPLQPLWDAIGLQNWAWSTDAWAARWFVILGDSWQWIPFIFIAMLAALENVSRDQVEAAEVDGASNVMIFQEITWPQIMPVAMTILLIRMVEAFKIVDLPNIMTSGGPGIATESITLHSYFLWRANDMGSSSAVAYLLLILTVVVCASFFNYIVLGQFKKTK